MQNYRGGFRVNILVLKSLSLSTQTYEYIARSLVIPKLCLMSGLLVWKTRHNVTTLIP